MATMQAWVARDYGPPEKVLRLEKLPIPEPQGRQVLVRILASSLNPIDLRMLQGYGARLRRLVARREFPFIPGRDVVGEVVDSGPEVTKFETGDLVVGITDLREIGAHAQFSAISETNLTHAPPGIPPGKLAAIPYVAMTTWSALVGRLDLDPSSAAGKSLFVHAGSGGIGSFTIQWAKSLEMKVSTTCGPSNVEWVKELGADVVVNYRDQDYREIVQDVDFAYDTLGGKYEKGTVALVKSGGGYVSLIHPTMRYTDRFGLFGGGLAAIGTLVGRKILHGMKGRKYAWAIAQPSEAGITHVMEKVGSGKVSAVIDRELPMKDIISGFEHLASGRAKGKVVLLREDV